MHGSIAPRIDSPIDRLNISHQARYAGLAPLFNIEPVSLCRRRRLKYSRELYPEHPRALDYDRVRGPIHGYPGGGGYAGDVYDIAYAKAMLQAALVLEKAW